MRYYIIAGEASGDLHASNLMNEIRKLDPPAQFRCWGGDLMKMQGGEIVKHYRDLAFMGFAEVLKHLPAILRNFRLCEHDMLTYRPDALILVDYPGFNLRMASFASKHRIRVFYYISPQLWAWRSSRVKIIKKHVERMFVILPFEKDFYAGHNYSADYVGHPLLDVIHDEMPLQSGSRFLVSNCLDERPVIAILPGSRKMEIAKMLRIMLSVRDDFPEYQFVIAGAPAVEREFYTNITRNLDVHIVQNQTYDLLKQARAALVTSGTATLETALMKVPQVVCYKGSNLSYQIAKRVIRVKYISLVNLVDDNEMVTELIQKDLDPDHIREALRDILPDGPRRNTILQGYSQLKKKLGGRGASSRTAALICQAIQKK